MSNFKVEVKSHPSEGPAREDNPEALEAIATLTRLGYTLADIERFL